MNIEQAVFHEEFSNHEQGKSHLSYEREAAFYQSIKMGNTKEAMNLFMPLDSDGMGKLSENHLRNLKYHLIITIAFITRYCIEGGMETEDAYNLSDVFIQKLDKCHTEDEIHQLHVSVVKEYSQRMYMILKRAMHSKPIMQCMEYISTHLYTKISLADLSELVNLSSEYLSKLFHSEVGMTISKYITAKKIEAAEKMLRYSEFSCGEIANYLCFSSESHFISVFKKHNNTTPKEYKEQNFRSRK